MIVKNKYFSKTSKAPTLLFRAFLVLLFLFAILFFMQSLMKYNKSMELKKEKEAYLEQLDDDVEQLRYLLKAPLDDEYKIRIAREKLGMCFPDEIVFHTDFE